MGATCGPGTSTACTPTRARPAQVPPRSGHRWPTSPTVTVGGYDGLYVELSVPDDIDVAACPGGVFNMWPTRWQEHPGQVDMVWIVDVEGRRITFDASYESTASPAEVAELREMVATATFAPADGT